MGGRKLKALIVGATGMLSRVVWQLSCLYQVTAIARNRQRLESLVRRSTCQIVGVSLDYFDDRALEATLAERGPFDLAVVWAKSQAANAPLLISRYVTGPFFHVLSSRVADPQGPGNPQESLLTRAGVDYRPIILGFVLSRGKSRWLTHREISDGVLQAIFLDKKRHVVGTLEPWSMRP